MLLVAVPIENLLGVIGDSWLVTMTWGPVVGVSKLMRTGSLRNCAIGGKLGTSKSNSNLGV
jgi:hypothetical protein